VKDDGLIGLSLHAAHGYLISQFLNPLSHRRTDPWGDSLENRARFLLDAIVAIRRTLGPLFPIGIKLSASDFRKGGFTNAVCVELVKLLNGVDFDLLELSGGTLERPKVVGLSLKDEGEDGQRTSIRREAYFVAFAVKCARSLACP
jgi:2,4-dienoyl-CoA reductase-like NADH-dependent reductase (Old Yellow Enzyme family)